MCFFQEKYKQIKKEQDKLDKLFKTLTHGCKYKIKQESIGFDDVSFYTCGKSNHVNSDLLYAECSAQFCPLTRDEIN